MKRLLFTLALLPTLFLPVRAEDEILLPVLMYHEVRPDQPGKDSITPQELESDLRWLSGNGYTAVTMREVIAAVYDGAPLPEKPIVLSFDDGYYNNILYLPELLKRYDMKIVLSVIGKSADEFSEYPSGNLHYAHATWEQLREFEESGLAELQHHSYALHRLDAVNRGCCRQKGESGAAYEKRLSEDTLLMQQRLYDECGHTAECYVYPYGFYEPETSEVLRELGFQATLSCDFGVNRLTHDPDCLMGMKRICRSHGAELKALLRQGLGAAALP